MDIAQKTIVITGATGGLGTALIPKLHQAGARIIAVGRNSKILSQIQHSIGCETVQADLLTKSGLQKIYTLMNTSDVDIVINASAVLDMQHIRDASDSQIDDTIALNITSLIKICKHAVSIMEKKSSPCKIVNVSSVIQDFPVPYLAVYSATKYAVKGFTQALQRELSPSHISTLLVAPRGMDTPMLNEQDRQFIGLLPGGLDTPTVVADKIVWAIKKDKRHIKIGMFETLGGYIHAIIPWSIDIIFKILKPKFKNIVDK